MKNQIRISWQPSEFSCHDLEYDLAQLSSYVNKHLGNLAGSHNLFVQNQLYYLSKSKGSKERELFYPRARWLTTSPSAQTSQTHTCHGRFSRHGLHSLFYVPDSDRVGQLDHGALKRKCRSRTYHFLIRPPLFCPRHNNITTTCPGTKSNAWMG